MLAVSRAGFYAWRRRPTAARTREDQVLAVAVAAIYAEHQAMEQVFGMSRPTFGTPAIYDGGPRLCQASGVSLARFDQLEACYRKRLSESRRSR
jgi:hypothetical protein